MNVYVPYENRFLQFTEYTYSQKGAQPSSSPYLSQRLCESSAYVFLPCGGNERMRKVAACQSQRHNKREVAELFGVSLATMGRYKERKA